MSSTLQINQRTRGDMGEVRVPVTITNAVDDVLARRGQLPKDKVRVVETEALVDTGSVRSVLPEGIVQALGLGIRDRRVTRYADGREETVGITDPILVEWEGRDTLEEALVLGDEVLIGQTVLETL